MEINLHKILFDEPPAKMGVVTGVNEIGEDATPIIQEDSVASCQSQGGTQGNGFVTPRSTTLIRPSITNIDVVYLKPNVQKSGKRRFDSREIKMVYSRHGGSEDSRFQMKSVSFVDSRQFKLNYATTWTKIGLPLDVEVCALRLNIDSSDGLLNNCVN